MSYAGRTHIGYTFVAARLTLLKVLRATAKKARR
jgi:hypothetical protein